MAGKESIAVAYVQIQPTAVGMKESLTGLLGSDADAAGQAAGKKAGKAMGDAAAAEGKKAGVSLAALSTGAGTVAAGLAPISGAVRGFGATALTASRNFEEAMSSVQAITGVNAAEFHDLREKAIAMGAATRFSASEAAEAMTYMGMAGWEVEETQGGDCIVGIVGPDCRVVVNFICMLDICIMAQRHSFQRYADSPFRPHSRRGRHTPSVAA